MLFSCTRTREPDQEEGIKGEKEEEVALGCEKGQTAEESQERRIKSTGLPPFVSIIICLRWRGSDP